MKNKIGIKILIFLTVLVTLTCIFYGCKKTFSMRSLTGSMDWTKLKTKKGLIALLTGVYGVLDGQGVAGDPWETSAVNWATAGVAADDAYKGTDANDQPQMTEVEMYQSQSANRYFYNKWLAVYEGVSRANDVIRLASDPEYTRLNRRREKRLYSRSPVLESALSF